MPKTILDLDFLSAREFFLSEEQYSTIDLPPYLEFNPVIKQVRRELNDTILPKKLIQQAKNKSGINYIIYSNKDGRYQWRKYELINPIIYTSLVNTLTDYSYWKYINKRLRDLRFQDPTNPIQCVSMPVTNNSHTKSKKLAIKNWLEKFERKALRLALDYSHVFCTDITDCYGSIYTHTIPWALHGKKTSKINRDYSKLLGNIIDNHLQAMSYGQTVGIPQGSTITDFIAEIILIYADYLLLNKLSRLNTTSDYKILRFRDDYKVFTNDFTTGEIIIKSLSEILTKLQLRLNAHKTFKSDDSIQSSYKDDKYSYLHIPLPSQFTGRDHLLKELLIVYKIGKNYPNCGQVQTRLSNINKIIQSKNIVGQETEIISILANTALDNPRAFPAIAALISKCLENLDNNEKTDIISKLTKKMSLLPNSGLLEVWIQRIAIPNSIQIDFNETLCKLVDGEDIKVFDSSWITDEYKKLKQIINNSKLIINKQEVDNLDKKISPIEYNPFAIY